jgi:hypothetical protein
MKVGGCSPPTPPRQGASGPLDSHDFSLSMNVPGGTPGTFMESEGCLPHPQSHGAKRRVTAGGESIRSPEVEDLWRGLGQSPNYTLQINPLR